MGKIKKPKCVMILTEGPSDRAALTNFFTEIYAMIDENIEVFFPILTEESISADDGIEKNYNGDITSRNGVTPENILPMLLKMFIHPEFKKHPAYEYPASVVEVIHIVDIDGVFISNERIIEGKPDDSWRLPYYDDVNGNIVVKDLNEIVSRNEAKRKNLQKLIETKKLRITVAKGRHDEKEKPYRVFFFSSNLDHVLFQNANNESHSKVPDARRFGNAFYDETLKLASYFLKHPCAIDSKDYKESWDNIQRIDESLKPLTNINILVKDLLNRANIREENLPDNDIEV